MMKPGFKNPLKRVLDLTLYLSFCLLVGTGALMYWRLVPGSRGGHGLTFFGMDRHEWGDVHLWVGIAFLAATIMHLVLNWAWLKKIAASSHAWRLWLGLVAGLGIILFFVLVPIERDPDATGSGHGQSAGHEMGHDKGHGKGLGTGQGRGQGRGLGNGRGKIR